MEGGQDGKKYQQGQMEKGGEGREDEMGGCGEENVISEAVKSYSFINKNMTRPIMWRIHHAGIVLSNC